MLHSQATELKNELQCLCAHVCVCIKQELSPFGFFFFFGPRGQVSFMSPPRSMDVTSDCSNLYINIELANHNIAWDRASQ